MKQRKHSGAGNGETVAAGQLIAEVQVDKVAADVVAPESGTVTLVVPEETEGMLDGTDAVSDWAFLNAMLNTAAGASWVSISTIPLSCKSWSS